MAITTRDETHPELTHHGPLWRVFHFYRLKMSAEHHTAESAAAITAKLAPPASVSIASFMGVQVSELLLWATLIYTVLLIGHKLYNICKDVFSDFRS